ncbi:MAG TPA: alcohol dehydrogenase catalytic domain-containing protein, partial [Pirellulales bacterium]|nr:alcohol dehydrogenase catalytic domain-containing protein [Pirellulales bacterium]
GYDFLVLGHESFGIVEQVGWAVKHVKPGDYVTATVRRPGGSIYDKIGTSDMTSEETYYERGINLLHGFMTEYYVDDAEFIVRMPVGLKHLHVLAEPMSCAAKAVQQAYEVQRRLRVWRPHKAFVMGAGQIGLLTTLVLRLRGLEVYTLARSKAPTLPSEIATGMGATYISTRETPLEELAKQVGKADLIVDATGSSAQAFGAMKVLGHNGVLVWTSVTGGHEHVELPSDKINLDWVLGNKLLVGSVNANREHFEMGIKDMAMGEVTWPGVLERILTHPVQGLENYQRMMELLVDNRNQGALKVYMEVGKE